MKLCITKALMDITKALTSVIRPLMTVIRALMDIKIGHYWTLVDIGVHNFNKRFISYPEKGFFDSKKCFFAKEKISLV